MASVYVSIGSNIEPASNVCSCMQHLEKAFHPVTFSRIYQTPAEGFTGNPFLNLVAGFETPFAPDTLRTYLRQLEDKHGRVRNGEKFSSRSLDLDLLLYDDLNLQPDGNLPHNDILKYPFVLFPLAEIAPDHRHPGLQRTILSLAQTSSLEPGLMQAVTLDCSQFQPTDAV
jgi:2-amino-4-hydroxy-6-hydroxymethyldihydropteridine diphosphokinase